MLYNEFTEESLTKMMLELMETKEKKENNRKMIVRTGKYGYIEYKKACFEYIGMSKEEIEEKIKHLEDTLPEGYYRIG